MKTSLGSIRKKLAGDSLSDHIVLLRLYQVRNGLKYKVWLWCMYSYRQIIAFQTIVSIFYIFCIFRNLKILQCSIVFDMISFKMDRNNTSFKYVY